MEKTVLSPWKSFLALKNFNLRILSTFEGSFSIHSLSDLGDLSNLIGSLSLSGRWVPGISRGFHLSEAVS